jgi:hypothetical protein
MCRLPCGKAVVDVVGSSADFVLRSYFSQFPALAQLQIFERTPRWGGDGHLRIISERNAL